jgi:hypothetical protein
MNQEIIEKVTNSCVTLFADKKNFNLPEEYHYAHLPLCAIDSVFSIGVKYEGVKNTISRFCDHFKIEKYSSNQEMSTSDFLKLIEQYSIEELTENIFRNKQRTSTNNGILKSEAVILFLKVLQKFGVENLKDISKINDSARFETEIKRIPGQKSGISLKYFFMLAGSDELIKPDRMILRFLENVTGKHLNLDDCQIVLAGVTVEMRKVGFNLSPKKLDNLIWNYQRSLN